MSYQASPDAQQQRGETPEAQTVLSEVDAKLPTSASTAWTPLCRPRLMLVIMPGSDWEGIITKHL
jgi:hypothetical protein